MLPTANLLLTYLLTICQGGPLLANRAACPNPTRSPTPNPNLNPNQVEVEREVERFVDVEREVGVRYQEDNLTPQP